MAKRHSFRRLARMSGRAALVALVAAVAASAHAKVEVGANILVNGAFEADQTDFPQGWTFFPTHMVRPEWHPTGGPGGVPCITFANESDGPSGKRQIRQMGIRLSTEGRYRISAWVRPHEGFRTERFWLLAVNEGWHAARGARQLPEVGKWTRVSEEFSGFKSKGKYYCTVCLADFHGSIDIADLRLEALDEAAAEGSEYAVLSSFQSAPRIVPWGPLLGEVPETTREVSFRFLGELPCGFRREDCDMSLGGAVQALSATNTFRLPVGAKEGTLSVRVTHRATGSNVVARTFRYRTVAAPSPDNLRKHRRLNNYVTEVLRGRFKGSHETTSFGVARRKWVHILVRSRGSFTVSLDGRSVIDSSSGRKETFREVEPGDHCVEVDGIAEGDEICVRTIPELLNYAPRPSRIAEIEPFDWEFQKRYALPAVTTMNGGAMPSEPDELSAYRASGRRWLDNLMTTKPKSADDIAARLASAAAMTAPCFDGVTCDEQFCGRDEVNALYMLGLRKYDLDARPERSIYTWLVGKPMSGIFDAEFLSDCANVSLGRGMVITETYSRSRSTEEAAKVYIESYICEKMRRYLAAWPSAAPSMGMVLGNFVQSPILSLHHHCEIDYRYYLDMQLNALANDPAFAGLGLAGYWGSYYLDEDTFRWCFRLLRHYCIEGNTDMLSERHGLKYRPGHLKNADFRKGLEGWTAYGAVSVGVVKDFGERSLGLYGGADGVGDEFAVLERGDVPNRLSQKIVGLVPGEKYSLQFVSFDADDAAAHRFSPKRIAVDATLTGVDIQKERSWTHVDRRAKTRHGVKSDARVNFSRIVFTANAPSAEFSFTDAAAKPGDRTGVNWIHVVRVLE